MDLNGLEADLVNAIKESTNEVCSTMLMLDVKSKESVVKNEKNISTDLISSLHFFSSKYMGKIAIFTSGKTACHLAGAMLGMEVEEIDEDVKDCMGEIANMIAGGAKTKLQDNMGLLHLLTPWVISGKKLTIASHSEEDEGGGGGGGGGGLSLDSQAQFSWVMTEFVFDNGKFSVGIQPNEVTDDASYHAELEKKLSELEKENKKLKKEIAKSKK